MIAVSHGPPRRQRRSHLRGVRFCHTFHGQFSCASMRSKLILSLKASMQRDRKSTRLNSSHSQISYAVFCLKKKKNTTSLHSYSSWLSHSSIHTLVSHST